LLKKGRMGWGFVNEHKRENNIMLMYANSYNYVLVDFAYDF